MSIDKERYLELAATINNASLELHREGFIVVCVLSGFDGVESTDTLIALDGGDQNQLAEKLRKLADAVDPVACCDMCDAYPATFVAEVGQWFCPAHLKSEHEKASGATKAPMICDGCGLDATFSCLHHVGDKRLCPVCFKKANS